MSEFGVSIVFFVHMNDNLTKFLATQSRSERARLSQIRINLYFTFQVRIASVQYRPVVTIGSRNYTTQAPTQQTAGEVQITEILRQKFIGATYIKVEDISGRYRNE